MRLFQKFSFETTSNNGFPGYDRFGESAIIQKAGIYFPCIVQNDHINSSLSVRSLAPLDEAFKIIHISTIPVAQARI
jgi:hypothetical protein